MEIPHYLKLVTFSYTVRTTVTETGSHTTNTIGGELYVPTYMDPEWNIQCYLLAYPVKNDDPAIHKELISIILDNFVVQDDVVTPDDPEGWEYRNTPEVIEPYPEEVLYIEEEEILEPTEEKDTDIKEDLD